VDNSGIVELMISIYLLFPALLFGLKRIPVALESFRATDSSSADLA